MEGEAQGKGAVEGGYGGGLTMSRPNSLSSLFDLMSMSSMEMGTITNNNNKDSTTPTTNNNIITSGTTV